MDISRKTAWLSVLVNTVLTGLKAVLAVLTGSLAIKADAIHSLTDVVSSLIIVAGITISQRSSQRFPYGLYKVENLVSLGTSLLIFIAGYEIVSEVLTGSSLLLAEEVPLAIGGVLLSIVITFAFSRYESKKGLETGSPSLIADAKHIWTDMLSSVVILAALLGSLVGIALDRYAALVVVLFIAHSAFVILLDSVRVLLDASLDYASVERIRETALADPRVVEIKELRARNAGRYKFVELDVVLRVKELSKGHTVSQEIEQRIKSRLENVDHVVIHFQPLQKRETIFAVPLDHDKQTISLHFGEAPFFRLVTVLHQNGENTMSADSLYSNPFSQEEKAKGIKVANWLLEKSTDILIVRQDLTGKGPAFVLGDAEASIIVTNEPDADKALSQSCLEII
jgi:cation diffusion facilitator family transporter